MTTIEQQEDFKAFINAIIDKIQSVCTVPVDVVIILKAKDEAPAYSGTAYAREALEWIQEVIDKHEGVN